MSNDKPTPGQIIWRDLTVERADELLPFYEQVVGWTARPHPMGEYDDYELQDASGQTVAGLCHKRGVNGRAPSAWLIYVEVPDVEAAAARCRELGGEVLDGPRRMGAMPFVAIRDPRGACLGLIQSPPTTTEA